MRLNGKLHGTGRLSCGLSGSGRLSGAIHAARRLFGSIHSTGRLSGAIHARGQLCGTIGKPEIVQVEEYTGAYEFTPAQETQIIEIVNKKAIADITINPIPSNYGLITWNGTVLTVS